MIAEANERARAAGIDDHRRERRGRFPSRPLIDETRVVITTVYQLAERAIIIGNCRRLACEPHPPRRPDARARARGAIVVYRSTVCHVNFKARHVESEVARRVDMCVHPHVYRHRIFADGEESWEGVRARDIRYRKGAAGGGRDCRFVKRPEAWTELEISLHSFLISILVRCPRAGRVGGGGGMEQAASSISDNGKARNGTPGFVSSPPRKGDRRLREKQIATYSEKYIQLRAPR